MKKIKHSNELKIDGGKSALQSKDSLVRCLSNRDKNKTGTTTPSSREGFQAEHVKRPCSQTMAIMFEELK